MSIKDIEKLRVTDIVGSHPVKGPNFTDSKADKTKEPAPESTKSSVSINGHDPYKKYSETAFKKRGAEALFRKKTGIGLDPMLAKALKGPMKEAALMFIKNPKLINTEEGGKKMRQLMSNVEGFEELA